MTDRNQLNIRLSPELMQMLRLAAQLDERTVSEWVRDVIREAASDTLAKRVTK